MDDGIGRMDIDYRPMNGVEKMGCALLIRLLENQQPYFL
jgi:hypothetical protein